MSKILLFVCLVLLGTVYADTVISLINAKYDGSGSISPALVADLNDNLNITTIQPASFYGYADPKTNIPSTDYLTLPVYAFKIGEPLTVSVVNLDTAQQPPFTPEASANITLVENQSYSFVYIAQSDDTLGAITNFPTALLLPFEERPNPSPFGKALVKIVNIAVSTFDPPTNMVVNVTGASVAGQLVTVPFGQASDFLEYDAAVSLTLNFTLPLSSGSIQRSIPITTVVNSTVVVYIRGDIGDLNQLGQLAKTVGFAFPAAPTPVAEPVTPPTAGPAANEPLADAPVAPVAPTAPTARTPTKKVSSAAQTVAQIAGVAGLMGLLF